LKPLETGVMCMASHRPFLSSLAKKLAGMSGSPKEQQWFHQSLFLAVFRGNAARILACVQIWYDFSHSQCTNQYYCSPLAFVSNA